MSKFLHENSRSKKGHNFVKKIEGLPPQLVWVPLLIVNYSEFQVNIFSNNRNLKMSKFLHENSKSKKGHNFVKKNWRIIYPTGMGSPFDSELF